MVKVFQRGPTQAQPPPSRRGPHRKTFTIAAFEYSEPTNGAPRLSM